MRRTTRSTNSTGWASLRSSRITLPPYFGIFSSESMVVSRTIVPAAAVTTAGTSHRNDDIIDRYERMWRKFTFRMSSSSSSTMVDVDDGDPRHELQTSYTNLNTANVDDSCLQEVPTYQRVWKAQPMDNSNQNASALDMTSSSNMSSYWSRSVQDRDNDEDFVHRIEAQEVAGGRMRQRQLGVMHQDPATDMQLLTEGYTVKAIASALRDREDALQLAAVLAEQQDWTALAHHLSIFHPKYVIERRLSKFRRFAGKNGNNGMNDSHSSAQGRLSASNHNNNILERLERPGLELIRRELMRMPRTVTQAHSKRAGVVLALCSVAGVPCILLEKRAAHLRAHADEVCLPGGMVSASDDPSIVATCLREMNEEIRGLPDDDTSDPQQQQQQKHSSHHPQSVDVLGVFRCNWGDVHHLVGVAVTPVVCYLGEIQHLPLDPNPDEVAEVFTIPLRSLMNKSMWIRKEGLAPIFVGGPYVIWGLTGYIVERFARDILFPLTDHVDLPELACHNMTSDSYENAAMSHLSSTSRISPSSLSAVVLPARSAPASDSFRELFAGVEDSEIDKPR